MPVQAVPVTFLVQQQQKRKDRQVPCAVLDIILLLSITAVGGWADVRNLMVQEPPQHDRDGRGSLFVFMPTSFLLHHSRSITDQPQQLYSTVPSCSYHQAPDFSEIRALNLPVSLSPSTHKLSLYHALRLPCSTQSTWKMVHTQKNKPQLPLPPHAHLLPCLTWGCLSLLVWKLQRSIPTCFKERKMVTCTKSP